MIEDIIFEESQFEMNLPVGLAGGTLTGILFDGGSEVQTVVIPVPTTEIITISTF